MMSVVVDRIEGEIWMMEMAYGEQDTFSFGGRFLACAFRGLFFPLLIDISRDQHV